MNEVELYKVSVLPMNIEFDIRSDETVIEAALRQSVRLPHRCTAGHCGACLSKLVKGDAHYMKLEPMMTEKEKAAGLALICQLYAKSDLVIELMI